MKVFKLTHFTCSIASEQTFTESIGVFGTPSEAVDAVIKLLDGTPASIRYKQFDDYGYDVVYKVEHSTLGWEEFEIRSVELSAICNNKDIEEYRNLNNKLWDICADIRKNLEEVR